MIDSAVVFSCPVGKEPDYLQINVFSRTSKGNIIYARQNKNLLFMVNFGAYSILSLLGILKGLFSRLFIGFLFYFSYKKFIKKSLPTYRPLNILKILKR